MNYTTKLGNTYDLAEYIDYDMPYGDYKELVAVASDIAPTMDGWCGTDFNIEDTDIITVSLCLNPENTQNTLYAYIPEAERADYELEIQMMESNRYTDYSDTLADRLSAVTEELGSLEEDLEYYQEKVEEEEAENGDQEEIEYLKERISDIIYDIDYTKKEEQKIRNEIKDIEEKCVWNYWS